MSHATQQVDEVVIRFAGDSGDGMQLTGGRFTDTTAIVGNDLSTLPDFPAEIRAPAGSLAGVSAFQIKFSSKDIHTPGDTPFWGSLPGGGCRSSRGRRRTWGRTQPRGRQLRRRECSSACAKGISGSRLGMHNSSGGMRSGDRLRPSVCATGWRASIGCASSLRRRHSVAESSKCY